MRSQKDMLQTVKQLGMPQWNLSKDITDIFSDWGFDFTDEAAVLNYSKNDVLIIDEFQETNPLASVKVEPVL